MWKGGGDPISKELGKAEKVSEREREKSQKGTAKSNAGQPSVRVPVDQTGACQKEREQGQSRSPGLQERKYERSMLSLLCSLLCFALLGSSPHFCIPCPASRVLRSWWASRPVPADGLLWDSGLWSAFSHIDTLPWFQHPVAGPIFIRRVERPSNSCWEEWA